MSAWLKELLEPTKWMVFPIDLEFNQWEPYSTNRKAVQCCGWWKPLGDPGNIIEQAWWSLELSMGCQTRTFYHECWDSRIKVEDFPALFFIQCEMEHSQKDRCNLKMQKQCGDRGFMGGFYLKLWLGFIKRLWSVIGQDNTRWQHNQLDQVKGANFAFNLLINLSPKSMTT